MSVSVAVTAVVKQTDLLPSLPRVMKLSLNASSAL
jgi:hypothetical protein